MSEEKKTAGEAADPNLEDLLDNALEDFDKLPKPAAKKETPADSKATVAETEEEVVDEAWSQDFIKQTAEQFEKNLQNLLENGGDGEFSGSLQQMAQTVANAMSSNNESDGDTNDFQAAIAQALKDISATSETLQNSGAGITEADLAAMFGQTNLDDSGGDMLPLMQTMMQSLLSKEILYPSLKDIVDRYPAWLEEKKASLSDEDFARYNKQHELMKKVCTELEKENANDSDQVKKERFDLILNLMQEMQNCGQPPEELVGEQTSLFQFDNDGNPMLPALPPGVDPQNCSIM